MLGGIVARELNNRRSWTMRITLILFAVVIAAGSALGETIALPPVREDIEMSVIDAMGMRRTIRDYTDREVSDEDLATILWSAYGVNRENGKKTVPVAIGVDYMRIYVARSDGAWKYIPETHELERVTDSDIRGEIGMQGFVSSANLVLVLVFDSSAYSLVFDIALSKESQLGHGHATSGCTAQNVHLTCAAMDYGTCMIAMIKEGKIRKHLALEEKEIPLYIMPIGGVEEGSYD